MFSSLSTFNSAVNSSYDLLESANVEFFEEKYSVYFLLIYDGIIGTRFRNMIEAKCGSPKPLLENIDTKVTTLTKAEIR